MSVYLFNKTENLIGTVNPKNVKDSFQDYNLNGLITAYFKAEYDEKIEEAEFFGHRDIDDPSIFWLYKITDKEKHDGIIEISGIYSLFDDLQGGVVRDIRPQKRTASEVLTQILENSRWNVGKSSSKKTRSGSFYYLSTISAFWKLLDDWNVEFKPRITFANGNITGRFVDLADHFAENNGKWYEYGDKLLTVRASTSNENIFTAFLGRGRGEETEGGGFGRKINFEDVEWKASKGDPVDKPLGQDYVEIKEATADYGYLGKKPRIQLVDFPDCEDPAELLQLTYNYGLQHCRPLVHYAAEVKEKDLAKPGEIVSIIRPDLNIRYQTRIFRLRRNFLIQGKKSIEFGEKLVRSQAQRMTEHKKELDRQSEENYSLYERNRRAIVDSYFNTDAYTYELKSDNEYGLPAGTYSFDKPIDEDPTEVIYIGAGKWLIANSKNADGSWNWRTFADGNGLGAETVGAKQIQTGAIKAQDIYFGGGTVADKFNESDKALAEYQKKLNELQIGGRNLLINSVDARVETTSNSETHENADFPIFEHHLKNLVGKKIMISAEVDTQGEHENIGTSSDWFSGIARIHTREIWVDSVGNNPEKAFNANTTGNKYNFNGRLTTGPYLIKPPEGYDTLKSFSIRLQLGIRPVDPEKVFSISLPQIEFGTKDTDWGPAPEDEVNREQEAISRMRREAEEAANNYAAAQIEAEKVRSQAYADNILTMAEQEAVAQAESAEQEAKKYMDQREAAINAFTEYLVQKYTEEVRTYIRTDEATGDLLIGKAGNPIILRQTNDRISFSSNGQEVAFFSNNKLYVTEAEILNSLILGKFAFIVEADSSVSFKWIGGEIA